MQFSSLAFQSIRVTRGRRAGLALRPRPLDAAAGRAAAFAAISLHAGKSRSSLSVKSRP